MDTLEIFNGIKKTLKKGPDGKPENAKDLTFTQEQIKVLFSNIEDRSKLLFVILTMTGVREGEVVKLQWNRINWKERLIELRPQDTKEKKAKEVPIPGEILPMLYRLYGDGKEGRIFALTKDQFIGDFKKACKLSGIKYGRKAGATVHTLRHTFVTNALTMPSIYRKMITGHSSSEMDERYSHPKVEDLRKAMEGVSQSVSFYPLVSEEPKDHNQPTA